MNEKLTLIPITFGMGYATVYDVSLNLVGFGKNYIAFASNLALLGLFA